MTGRLEEITARIAGMGQLDSVVNAMRGIAATRALQARQHLPAAAAYAAMLAEAITATAPGSGKPDAVARQGAHARTGLVVFGAEDGFAGNFTERIVDSARADMTRSHIFVIGTRAAAIMETMGFDTRMRLALPARATGMSRLADRIAEALYPRIAQAGLDRLEAIFGHWATGGRLEVKRRQLFPLDMTALPAGPGAWKKPLLNLDPSQLIGDLTAHYVHAQLCLAALEAFAAENEARAQAMASARREIERQMAALRRRQRIVRQEEITAEIIELAAARR